MPNQQRTAYCRLAPLAQSDLQRNGLDASPASELAATICHYGNYGVVGRGGSCGGDDAVYSDEVEVAKVMVDEEGRPHWDVETEVVLQYRGAGPTSSNRTRARRAR